MLPCPPNIYLDLFNCFNGFPALHSRSLSRIYRLIYTSTKYALILLPFTATHFFFHHYYYFPSSLWRRPYLLCTTTLYSPTTVLRLQINLAFILPFRSTSVTYDTYIKTKKVIIKSLAANFLPFHLFLLSRFLCITLSPSSCDNFLPFPCHVICP